MHTPAQAPEYCHGIDEESILKHQFELIFALDEVISLGYRENVNMVRSASATIGCRAWPRVQMLSCIRARAGRT